MSDHKRQKTSHGPAENDIEMEPDSTTEGANTSVTNSDGHSGTGGAARASGKNIDLIKETQWISRGFVWNHQFNQQWSQTFSFTDDMNGIILQYLKPQFWLKDGPSKTTFIQIAPSLRSVEIHKSILEIEVNSVNRQSLLESSGNTFTQTTVDNAQALHIFDYNRRFRFVAAANDETDKFLSKRADEDPWELDPLPPRS